MEFTRDGYLELMTFGRVERPMFVELFGLMVGVDREWHSQGAAEVELSLEDVLDGAERTLEFTRRDLFL